MEFHRTITEMTSGGLTTLEAIAEYCRVHDIDEPESVKGMINQVMFSKIQQEASDFRLLKPEFRITSTLDD